MNRFLSPHTIERTDQLFNEQWEVNETKPIEKVETKVFVNGVLLEHCFLIQELRELIKELKDFMQRRKNRRKG